MPKFDQAASDYGQFIAYSCAQQLWQPDWLRWVWGMVKKSYQYTDSLELKLFVQVLFYEVFSQALI